MPTLDQADMTVFQQQPLHTHICHNHRNYTVTTSIANTCQSYVNASGQRVLIQGTRTLCWTHLLVSTEDNFTPILTTITFPNPGQYLPIHQKSWTHLPSQCRSKANPGTMHQFYGIPVQICQFITNPSTIRQPIAADPVTI